MEAIFAQVLSSVQGQRDCAEGHWQGFAKVWGTKVEIVSICGAPKPWKATGGARILALGV